MSKHFSFSRHFAAIAAALATIPGATSAATVIVNGATDVAGVSYQTLSGAVNYTNTQGAGPHIINITVNNITDPGQIVISQPVTINGDGESSGVGDGTPCDILVDTATMEGVTNIGAAEKNYIEFSLNGVAELNNVKMHPNKQGGTGAGTTLINCVGTYKPASGTGNYSLVNVWVGPSHESTNAYLDATSSDNIYSNPKKWYANGGTNGIFNITNSGGAGAYNAALTGCRAAGARAINLNIQNKSGTTVVTGGVYSNAGETPVYVNGGTGVTFTGSMSNRVRVFAGNRSSNGEGFRVGTGSNVTLLEYVDSYGHILNASAFAFTGGTVQTMSHCRGISAGGTPFYLTGNSVVNLFNSTIHRTGTTPVYATATHTGSATLKDSIFTSSNNGQVYFEPAAVSAFTINNCALPTDGFAGETLNVTTPVVASAGGVTYLGTTVVASPKYVTKTVVNTNAANADFLRPTNGAAYTAAASDGSNLSGGAAGTQVPVSLSGFSIE